MQDAAIDGFFYQGGVDDYCFQILESLQELLGCQGFDLQFAGGSHIKCLQHLGGNHGLVLGLQGAEQIPAGVLFLRVVVV